MPPSDEDRPHVVTFSSPTGKGLGKPLQTKTARCEDCEDCAYCQGNIVD